MKEEIEILNPFAGKPVIIEINDNDWYKRSEDEDVAVTKTIICFAYTMSFTRNRKTGEMNMVYYEETKSD